MKSAAASITFLLLFSSVASFASDSRTWCECEKPPGGKTICKNPGEAAFCTVVNGQCEGRCYTPKEVAGDKLGALVISIATGKEVSAAQLSEKPKTYAPILREF